MAEDKKSDTTQGNAEQKPEAVQKPSAETPPNPKIGIKPRDILESEEQKKRGGQNLKE